MVAVWKAPDDAVVRPSADAAASASESEAGSLDAVAAASFASTADTYQGWEGGHFFLCYVVCSAWVRRRREGGRATQELATKLNSEQQSETKRSEGQA